MCEHLRNLDDELKQRNLKETFRGQAWGDNTREWVYYDCVILVDEVKKRYNFPEFIKIHVNNDSKSGMEAGFYCEQCKDGVMGLHPAVAHGKVIVS